MLTACDATLTPVAHTVDPGAGPAELGDADTDGNGIIDRDEWGPLADTPTDSDGDVVPDWQDVDDDNDGLPDRFDEERLTPAPTADLLDADAAYTFRADAVYDEASAYGAARAADTLHVSGRNFACGGLVAFVGGDEPVVAPIAEVGDDALRVIVPDGARGPLVVVQDGQRANRLDVHIAAAGEPLLFGLDDPTLIVGQTATLRGSALESVAEVIVNGASVMPSRVSADEVELVVPDTVGGLTDDVFVRTGDEVQSNRPFARVVREVPVQVTLPDGVDPADVELVHHLLRGEPLRDGGATVLARARDFDVVTAMHAPADGPRNALLQGLVFPDDDAATIDAGTDATATALLAIYADRHVALTSLPALRDAVAATPEVAALTSAVSAALAADPNDDDVTPRQDEVVAAINAAQAVMTAGLADGTFVPIDTSMAVVQAVIDPPMQEEMLFGVSQTPDTENVTVTNRTLVFASVAITEIERGLPLITHASGPAHPSVLGPQGGVLELLEDASKPFNQPMGRDARVQIVTPGTLSTDPAYQPTSPDAIRAQKYMRLRTLIQQVVVPLIEYGLGKIEVKSKLVNILISHAFAPLEAALAVWDAGDVRGAFETLATFFKDKLVAFLEGERDNVIKYILEGALEAAADGVAGELAERGAKAFAKRLPIIGFILELGELIALGIDLITTVRDLERLRGVYDNTVLFGLAIDRVTPPSFDRSCIGEQLTIWGTGFYPVFEGGAVQRPTVSVRDLGAPSAGEQIFGAADQMQISPDGRMIDIELPEMFNAAIQGPMHVEVTHRGETVMAPTPVDVNGMSITDIMPAAGGPGDTVTLRGDFRHTTSAARFVRFVAPGSTVDVRTLAVDTDDTISFVVPDLPASIPAWNVVVAREGGVSCTVTSNSTSFVTSDRDCVVELTTFPSVATAINDAGQVVGYSLVAGADCWVVNPLGTSAADRVWFADDDMDGDNDLVTQFTPPMGGTCRIVDINESGVMVGSHTRPGYREQAMWATTAGGINPIGTAVLVGRGGGSRLQAINDSGLMVGRDVEAEYMGMTGMGTLVSGGPGGLTFHGSPSPWLPSPAAVNDAGVIVGFGGTGGMMGMGRFGVIHDGTPRPLPTLDPMPDFSHRSQAADINNSGQIVGSSNPMLGLTRAVMWEGGVIRALADRGGLQDVAIAINDAGEIVGYASNLGARVQRAAIWLDTAAYGLPTGLTNLDDVSRSSGGSGIRFQANDINAHGQVVGNGTLSPAARSWLMDLSACVSP